MGTSTNQPSPNLPNWRITKAVIGNPKIPAERQSQEIWRAAVADRQGKLSADLSHPIIAQACDIADTTKSPVDAMKRFDRLVGEKRESGLLLDAAKRALVRASAKSSGAEGYTSELFSEVVSYYASRDLPSFVASKDRVKSTSESIALKNSLKEIAINTSKSVGKPSSDPKKWSQYVSNVLESLSKKGGGK